MSLDVADKAYIKEYVTDVVNASRQELKQDISGVKQDVYRLEVLLEDQATTLATVLELLTNQLGIKSTLDDHTQRLIKLEISDQALHKTVSLHSRQLGRMKGVGN